MRGTEVYVVVDDGTLFTGIFKETLHLGTYDGIDGIIGAEHHDVVGLDVRIDHVQTVVGMILIEDVLCIILLVEECERYG